MTDEQIVAHGRKAAKELELTEAAFEKVRAGLIKRMIETSTERPETILRMHLAVQTVTAVRQALLEAVQDGQIAEVALANAGLTKPV